MYGSRFNYVRSRELGGSPDYRVFRRQVILRRSRARTKSMLRRRIASARANIERRNKVQIARNKRIRAINKQRGIVGLGEAPPYPKYWNYERFRRGPRRHGRRL